MQDSIPKMCFENTKKKKNQKYAKLNILFAQLLGYEIHFGIS